MIDPWGNAKGDALRNPGGQNSSPAGTRRVGLVGHGRHGKTDLPTVRCTRAIVHVHEYVRAHGACVNVHGAIRQTQSTIQVIIRIHIREVSHEKERYE